MAVWTDRARNAVVTRNAGPKPKTRKRSGAPDGKQPGPPNRPGVTDSTTVPSATNASQPNSRRSPVGRTLMWVGLGLGIASVSVAVGIVAVRVALRREAPSDETADRIQALIDEANRLIKTLDEKKQA